MDKDGSSRCRALPHPDAASNPCRRVQLMLVYAVLAVACTPSVDSAAPGIEGQLVDLTHVFDENTVYWPTDTRGFQLETLASGVSAGGFYYAANAFCTAEHGGTHMDAPKHFNESGRAVDELPLESLVGSAVVVDISEQAAADSDYRLSLADLAAYEEQHGRIPQQAIVLLRTGWGSRWPDARAYLGDDTPGDASKLTFPSFGEEAVKFLLEERNVKAIGIDTASIDYGRSSDFPVHRLLAAQQRYGLENLANLEQLPPSGFTVIALPMKIGGGSGGPVRVVAMLPAG